MTVLTVMTAPARAHALNFVQPMPGFEGITDWSLQAIDEHDTLFSMRAVADPSLRFVLTPSDRFFDDYSPALESEVTEALGLADDDEITVLLVLTIPGGLQDATANMRAPIVVANGTGHALQVILDDEALPMRRPLVA